MISNRSIVRVHGTYHLSRSKKKLKNDGQLIERSQEEIDWYRLVKFLLTVLVLMYGMYGNEREG